MLKLLLTLALFNFLDNSLAVSLNSRSKCNILKHGVSGKEKNEIVNEHNRVRKMIMDGKVPNQPRGTNLKMMKWDDKLASAAQRVADSCIFEHQLEPDSRWQHVGQNLYIFMTTSDKWTSSWTEAIKDWFDEYKIYKFSNRFQHSAGHYTQLVWAKTDHVGCGYTEYFQDNQYNHLFACNYGPAGNYQGQFPYETK